MILKQNLHMFQDILEPKVENKNLSLEKKLSRVLTPSRQRHKVWC